jgi:hypothetical protein
MQGLNARLKLPLRHPVKGQGPHPGRKQAEAGGATSITVDTLRPPVPVRAAPRNRTRGRKLTRSKGVHDFRRCGGNLIGEAAFPKSSSQRTRRWEQKGFEPPVTLGTSPSFRRRRRKGRSREDENLAGDRRFESVLASPLPAPALTLVAFETVSAQHRPGRRCRTRGQSRTELTAQNRGRK